MTFPYRIEKAKTGRSHCSQCKQRIIRNAIRIRAAHGIEPRKGIAYYQLYCANCVHKFIESEEAYLKQAKRMIGLSIKHGYPVEGYYEN